MDIEDFVETFFDAQRGKSAVDKILAHYAIGYDPEQAHQYYLMTRQLKGRQPAVPPPVPVKPAAATKAVATPVKAKAVVKAPVVAKSPPKSAAELQIEANKSVLAIQAKLTELKHKLSNLMEQAKAADAKAAAAKKASAGKAAKPKVETQQEKAKAHTAYEKAKQAGTIKKKATSHHSIKDQVATVQSQITATTKQLNTLVTKLRAQAHTALKVP
jgi:hypothetical protein